MQALKRLHKWDFNNFNTSYFLPSGQAKKEEPCKGFFSPKVLILYFPEKPQLLVKKDGGKIHQMGSVWFKEVNTN